MSQPSYCQCTEFSYSLRSPGMLPEPSGLGGRREQKAKRLGHLSAAGTRSRRGRFHYARSVARWG